MNARICVLAALLLLGMLVEKSKGWEAFVATDSESGVKIKIASPLDRFPEIGFLPVRVTIENRTPTAREWKFRSILNCSGSSQIGTCISSESLHVAADSVGGFDLLMPLVVNEVEKFYRTASFEITGYAVVQRSNIGFPTDYHPGDRTVFTAFSKSLAARSMGLLVEEFKKTSRHFLVSALDLDLLSADWRALAGISCIWLTEAEFVVLRPEQRIAVKDYVTQGGALYICTQGPASAIRTEFGIAPDAKSGASYVLGRVSLMEWDGRELSIPSAVEEINRVSDPRREQLTSSYSELPTFVNSVGRLRLNTSFLIAFIVVFAVVVGPFNLFWFARGAQRSRMFWTTPVISLAATVVLGVLIVVQDGFGATGSRVLLTYLMPGEKKAVVMQEQIARSGLLLSRSFKADEALFFNPINTSGIRPQEGSRTYEQSGSHYFGDWFASRAVQGHFAEAIIPTRAEVRVLNSALLSESVPPILLSSLPVTLQEVRYLDDAGRSWHGQNLKTGEQLTLRLVKPSAFPAKDICGPLLQTAMAKVAGRKEHFWGVADDAPFLQTLSSIRWKQQKAIYVGPVTLTP